MAGWAADRRGTGCGSVGSAASTEKSESTLRGASEGSAEGRRRCWRRGGGSVSGAMAQWASRDLVWWGGRLLQEAGKGVAGGMLQGKGNK